MSYYVYENWTAEHKAVIHRGSCGNCNEGRGCHKNPLCGRNGRWHGAPLIHLEKHKGQLKIRVDRFGNIAVYERFISFS